MLHQGDERLFTDIAYEVSIRDLIDQGYLSPLVSKATESSSTSAVSAAAAASSSRGNCRPPSIAIQSPRPPSTR